MGSWLNQRRARQVRNFGRSSVLHLSGALLEHQVVHRDQVGGGEAQLGEEQVDAVETKGEFTLQLAQVGLAQAGTIADDEAALTCWWIFSIWCRRCCSFQPSAGLKDSSQHVPAAVAPPPISVGAQLPDGSGGEFFYGLTHGYD